MVEDLMRRKSVEHRCYTKNHLPPNETDIDIIRGSENDDGYQDTTTYF